MGDTGLLRARAVQDRALYDVSTTQDLSASPYDIAMASLVEGPHRQGCIDWLIENQQPGYTWGVSPRLSWYDTYICTYAASIALQNAGYTEIAEASLHELGKIVDTNAANIPETLTFGGLVAALDRYRELKGWRPVWHRHTVMRIMAEEEAKWERMRLWDRFYDPDLSIAGYCGERIFRDNRIDLARFVDSFQGINGSISNCAGASALILLELERRNVQLPANQVSHLRKYLHSLDPNQRAVGYLDFAPHFVTAWTLMFVSELGLPLKELNVIDNQIREMHGHLFDADGLRMLCPVGLTTIPGDTDSTACAIWAARYAQRQIPNIDRLDSMFVPEDGYYRTFRYERDPSISTNIHMASVLSMYQSPRLDEVLRWLDIQYERSHELICKWHVSPIYTMGEMARALSHIKHDISHKLAIKAAQYLLDKQQIDGGWGVLDSTVEETGYAILGIASLYDTLVAKESYDPWATLIETIYAALERASDFLLQSPIEFVPLWIGKSLYCVKPLVPVLYSVSIERIAQVMTRHAERIVKS